MDYVVVVAQDGMVYGMWHDDLIDLYERDIEVTRASHVEWSVSGWCVWEVDGVTPMSPQVFPTRDTALAWEVKEVNRRLIEGIL